MLKGVVFSVHFFFSSLEDVLGFETGGDASERHDLVMQLVLPTGNATCSLQWPQTGTCADVFIRSVLFLLASDGCYTQGYTC